MSVPKSHAYSQLQTALVNIAFLHDVTSAMLVFQNKEMAAMMAYQTNPTGIELYFYANTFFCFRRPIWLLVTLVKTPVGQVHVWLLFKASPSANLV